MHNRCLSKRATRGRRQCVRGLRQARRKRRPLEAPKHIINRRARLSHRKNHPSHSGHFEFPLPTKSNEVEEEEEEPRTPLHVRYWHRVSSNKRCGEEGEEAEEGAPWSHYITTVFSIRNPPPPPSSSPPITIPPSGTPSCISWGFNLRRGALSAQSVKLTGALG